MGARVIRIAPPRTYLLCEQVPESTLYVSPFVTRESQLRGLERIRNGLAGKADRNVYPLSTPE